MKKRHVILLVVWAVLASCSTEKVNPSGYWGCWEESTGKTGVFDVILTPGSPHNITLGEGCGDIVAASLDIGFFRNDTLIFDNGQGEFWALLQGDTLLYSAENSRNIEKLIKLQ